VGNTPIDSLQISDMNNAIPADVSAIDTNSDGIMDRLYSVDITGKIFRIDFLNEDATTTEARYTPIGRLFADLSGDNRRFFNAIDVAYSKMGLQPMIHLSVGSGLRPHPLFDSSNDRFYSVWDSHVFSNLPTGNEFTAITQNDLQSTTSQSQIDSGEMTHGWYFDLSSGEKSLSKATTLGGYVFFTTYFPPESSNTPSCTAKLGTGSLYVIKLHDSSSLMDGTRNIAINSPGIPSSPTFLTLAQPENDNTNPDNPFVNQETKTFIMVGTEIINEDTGGASNNTEDLQDLLTTLYPILDNPNAKFYWTEQ
jgi:type IV pilus assembly protein PilY1